MNRLSFLVDTIVAISTGRDVSAIGIVRLSGSLAISIVSAFVRRADGRPFSSTPSRFLCNVLVFDGEDVLDHGLGVIFRSPASVTGQDVVELHCHGNPVLLDRVVGLCVECGARVALPGEFTRRSLASGKIDLSRAESIGALLSAESVDEVRAAANMLDGEFIRSVMLLREEILSLLVRLEVDLDFVDEGYVGLSSSELGELVDRLVAFFERVERSMSVAVSRSSMASVVLCGAPNVGKSSLFNALLGFSRSIVSAVPGTTRDYLEERLDIRGARVRLLDTAGLRSVDDLIESEGIEKVGGLVAHSDLVVAMVDSSDCRGVSRAYRRLLAFVESHGPGNQLFVMAKSDVSVVCWSGCEVSVIDAVDLQGFLDALTEEFGVGSSGVRLGLSARQIVGVRGARAILGRMNVEESPVLLALDLRELLGVLEDLCGFVSSEDVLDRVFSSFCIGK